MKVIIEITLEDDEGHWTAMRKKEAIMRVLTNAEEDGDLDFGITVKSTNEVTP